MLSWDEFWQKVTEFFQSNVWNIVLFFSVLVGGIVVIYLVLFVTRKIMRKNKVDPMVIRFVAAIIRFVLILVLILALLSILGVPITGLTTAVSAAVLAVGMALKDFLANLAGGIILIVSGKYKTGDFVQVNGVEGSVSDINFLFTTLKTYDSTQVTLPNQTMVNSPVTNLGAYPIRRVAITFPVAYESDTQLVKKTLIDVMNSCGLVRKEPAPLCRLKELGESSINFFCTCYCDNEDYWDVYYYVMDYGFEACKKAGISFPFKQIELTQKERVPMPVAIDELPERVEKSRAEELRKLDVDDIEEMSLAEITAHWQKTREHNKKQKEKAKKEAKSAKKKAESADKENKKTKK